MARSKRKSSDNGDHAVKKKKRQDAESASLIDTSVFGELVTEAGVVLKADDKPNEIHKDQALFQRALTLALKRHPTYPQFKEDFVEAMMLHMDNIVRFRMSLMPSLTPIDCEASSCGGTQDALMRMLLGIDMLQPLIMEKLLEKLAELSGEEEVMFDGNEKVNLPKLILNQFRWLDKITNSSDLLVKMFEILPVTSEAIQREMIGCMPEVMEDAQHAEVARKLRDLLEENRSLTVPILDALSNLNLTTDLLSEVRGTLVQTLDSVELEDMPVIVKFLLQTATAVDALEVITELRGHLDLQAMLTPQSSSTPHGNSKHGSVADSDCEMLIVSAIRSAIRFQRVIAENWLKVLEGLKTTRDHKVVDVFVLFILHANNYRRPIESLCRNKIRAGHLTEVLLQASFTSHAHALREFFPSVLSLGEVLLRSPEAPIVYVGCALYKQAFLAFDAYCRQEIIGNQMSHVGSGLEGEVDAALDILLDLVQTNVRLMAPFAIFIKGVLDYLDNLSMRQIRKLYTMLSILGFQNARDEGAIQDELHMLIRKQLSNNDPKYKRMGVLGAIMVIKSLAPLRSRDAEVSPAPDADEGRLPDAAFRQVVSLLELVQGSAKRSAEVTALFKDEIASVVESGELAPKVESWIMEHVTSDFQDDYVADVDPDQREGTTVLSWDIQYGLDEEGEGSIAINLFPLLAETYQSRSLKNFTHERNVCSVLCLSSSFRLLQICECRENEGSLESVDALLGCPLYMPKLELMDKLESLSTRERELMCEALFLAINWFREVLNAFAGQDDIEMKAKVIRRIQHIITLQSILERCLAVAATYVPPPANLDLDATRLPTAPSVAPATGNKRGRKPGGKGKKKAQAEDPDQTGDVTLLDKTNTQTDTQADTGDGTGQAGKATVSLLSYRPYFRELDLQGLSILSTGLITEAALDTNMNTKATTQLSLQPPELRFLLEDLVLKMDHGLIASASKRRSFLKSKVDKNSGFSRLDQLTAAQVAQRCVDLLPALCAHLESTCAFFQALIAANDGVLDGPGSDTEEAAQMATCFQLLLQTLVSLFSWNGFVMSENRALFRKALTVTATRVNTTAQSQVGVKELLRQTFDYCENFSSTVADVTSAVTLSKLLVSLADLADPDAFSARIGGAALGFIKREWMAPGGQKPKGAKYNEQLQVLLKIVFRYTDDPISLLESLASVGIPELLDAEKDGSSTTYPTLTRNSFSMYYRVMLAELVGVAKSLSPGKPSDATEVKMKKLVRWNLTVRIFHIMVNLIKAFDSRTNIIAIMKYGRQVVETFLRQGMPMLDHMFRAHKEDVQSLLKNLQLSTRALQHMCGHSKIVKDVTLTNQVPLVKKVLEMFVYRVKAMLTVNQCLEAFWLGNLKNRDIQGGEIQSQSTRAESTDGDSDDDDAVPDDDNDSDVEVDNVVESSGNSDDEGGSYSDTY